MTEVTLNKKWRVRLKTEFDIPAGRQTVWSIVADFQRFVCTDHFHRSVEFTQGSGQVGSEFTILHRFLGIRVNRTGRILRWADGIGYAYSDLSAQDPQSAFPHVLFVEIADRSATRCAVRIRVNGRWTATFLGPVITRLWLRWNLLAIRHGVENAILREILTLAEPI